MGAEKALGSGEVLGFEDEGDVALEGEVREEADLLNDVADGAAEADEIAVASTLAGEEDFAAGGLEEAIDGAEEGGFAGTAAAEDGGGGAFVEGEGDAVEEEVAVGETEGEVTEVDGRGHRRYFRDSVRGMKPLGSVGVGMLGNTWALNVRDLCQER